MFSLPCKEEISSSHDLTSIGLLGLITRLSHSTLKHKTFLYPDLRLLAPFSTSKTPSKWNYYVINNRWLTGEVEELPSHSMVIKSFSPDGSVAEEGLQRSKWGELENSSSVKQSATLPGIGVFVKQQEHQNRPNGMEQWPIYSDILSPTEIYARFFWGRAKHHISTLLCATGWSMEWGPFAEYGKGGFLPEACGMYKQYPTICPQFGFLGTLLSRISELWKVCCEWWQQTMYFTIFNHPLVSLCLAFSVL